MELHSDAKAIFDKKGSELLDKVGKKINVQHSVADSFLPDIHICEHVSEKDIIGDIISGTVNQDGVTVTKWFVHDGQQVGLNEEHYQFLRKLAEDIQRNRAYRDTLGIAFIEDNIFEWLRLKYCEGLNQELMDFINEKAREVVREYEIWMPISALHVQSDFEVGKAHIKTITRQMLDQWIDRTRQAVPDQISEAQFQEYSKKQRKNVQGFAAAVVKAFAEPKRAAEMSFELAEEALVVLRALSPYNISSKRICYCVPLGSQNVQTYSYYHVSNGRIVNKPTGMLDQNYEEWSLSNHVISMLKTEVDILTDVLKKTEKTKFQETVFESLTMYSKSCLMKELSDKLVYILVALEALLLKNENEPIQQNIAERMAFVIEETADERKKVVKLVKDIYGLRSRFIHHGRSIKDIETLDQFMFKSFIFFCSMIHSINSYPTKEAFIEKLEELKFS